MGILSMPLFLSETFTHTSDLGFAHIYDKLHPSTARCSTMPTPDDLE